MQQVSDAVVAHVNRGYLVHPSGVFDQNRAYVARAVHWRGRPMMVPPPFPERTEHLTGNWLWGGVLMDHFGHFLTESLGRLWALPKLKGFLDGIVFLPERGFGETESLNLRRYQSDFLALLGIDLPVRILGRPSRIDRLVVPGPGFGIGPLLAGTPPFRSFIHDCLAPNVTPVGSEALYISRSRLDVTQGGILAERLLERYLADAGYEIYHPQDHGLSDQIARYRAARRIIGLDGSALHLVALVAEPTQKIAIIKRRKGSAPAGIERNIAGFTSEAPTVIDAIIRNWVRSDRRHADNYSFGELSFSQLGKQLAAQGFLPSCTEWPDAPIRRIEGNITWLNKKLARRGVSITPDGLLPRSTKEALASNNRVSLLHTRRRISSAHPSRT